MSVFSGNPPPPSGNDGAYDLLFQLDAFRAQTKFALNCLPYKIRMAAPSIKELADEFCSSSIGQGTAADSLMGIRVVECSLVPDHEAWVFYRDLAAELGFSVKKIKWGKPKSPLSGAEFRATEHPVLRVRAPA